VNSAPYFYEYEETIPLLFTNNSEITGAESKKRERFLVTIDELLQKSTYLIMSDSFFFIEFLVESTRCKHKQTDIFEVSKESDSHVERRILFISFIVFYFWK